MSKSSNWYVLTGGPSTGKTSLLAELEDRGYAVVPEAARTWIDENLTKGISVQQLRKDEKKFQEDILRLKQDIETAQPAGVVTFFDRGMHDTLAYLRHYRFEISDQVYETVRLSAYRKIFLLDRLPEYVQDYARTEDESFRERINDLLYEAYEEFGMKAIHVPALPIKQRAEFVLDHINQA